MTGVFKKIDVDGDGPVTIGELQKYLLNNMNGLRITRATVQYLIRKIDINGDGIIQVEEYELALNTVLKRFKSLNEKDSEDEQI